LIPAAVISAYFGSATATAIGFGAFGRWIMGSLFGAVASRPLESAMEAAEVYGETGNEEQANEVFKSNMYLTGLDFAEFATAFTPLKLLGGSATKSLTRRILATGGKVVGVGGMSAGEEVYQESVKELAMDKEINWESKDLPVFYRWSSLGLVWGVRVAFILHFVTE